MSMKTKLAAALVAAIMSAPLVYTPANATGMAKSNQFWWPELLDLGQLRAHDARSNPYGDDFDYAKAFESVDTLADYLVEQGALA